VDDNILIIYDKNKTHIDTMMTEFNTITPTINFTTENESDKKLSFLDLTTHQKHNKLNFMIYRKLTSTDILIFNSKCHPNEHKLASTNYLINRLHTYPLSKYTKEAELDIKTILQNNHYKLTHICTKTLKTKTF
jgi:hypothetical protein